MLNDVTICKIFTFDAAHQLIGHNGKCANLHGHTYKLEIFLKGPVVGPDHSSEEGFVIDFSELKKVVKEMVLSRLDHAFLAKGNEPIIQTLKETNSKIALLGFRTTVENLSAYICHQLKETGLPVHSVRLWETPTAWAQVMASDIPEEGPFYRVNGGCDYE